MGILYIFVGLGIGLITSAIFGQDLPHVQQQIQEVKRELSKVSKDIAELERLLNRAYEDKSQAQLVYDKSGMLGSMSASQRLDEATKGVSALEGDLKKTKEMRSKLRLARKEAEESLAEEIWNQSDAMQKRNSEEQTLKERAKSAGTSFGWKQLAEQSKESYREEQKWASHRPNATDGEKLMEELTGTNDDYFNEDENSIGNVLSEAYENDTSSSPGKLVYRARHVTFNRDDLLNAMTDVEREDFFDRRKELKELQLDGRSLKMGLADGRVVLERFEAQKRRVRKNLSLRGFRGKTVTVFGNPPPSKKEIMKMVMGGIGSFGNGDFGSGLSSYWKREASGAIVGLDSPPNNREISKESANFYWRVNNEIFASCCHGFNDHVGYVGFFRSHSPNTFT